jgi:recombination protein RecT
MSNALALVTDDIYAQKDVFMNVLADQSINFEREAGFAIQILSSKDYTLGIAASNRQSVANAVTNIAAIGISLNPAKKQAYLVPRNGEICLDISYIGLMDLAVASGSIQWGQAKIVRENDGFTLNKLDELPTHTYAPFSKDRGEIVGVYVVVKTASGDYLTHAMSIGEVYDIRDRSDAWKAFVAKKAKSCPWYTDPGEMIKKTCVKQASKYWPKTDRLSQAIHHLNTDGGEGMRDINAPPARTESWIDVDALVAAANQSKTDSELMTFWATHNPTLKQQPADHAKLKATVTAKRQALKKALDDNTIDMPAKGAAAAPEMDGLLADMEAAADGGAEALATAWASLSKATQGKLAPHYDALVARAERVAA